MQIVNTLSVPGIGDIPISPEIATPAGVAVKEVYDGELSVQPVGGGGVSVFATPNYVEEYAAWARYLKEHKLGVSVVHPRDFYNEFDLVLVPVADAELTGGAAARKLTRPYDDRWYGRIVRQDLVPQDEYPDND